MSVELLQGYKRGRRSQFNFSSERNLCDWIRKSTCRVRFPQVQRFFSCEGILKRFCICYNASRQKRDKKSMWAKETNPQIGMAVPSEDSSFLL